MRLEVEIGNDQYKPLRELIELCTSRILSVCIVLGLSNLVETFKELDGRGIT